MEVLSNTYCKIDYFTEHSLISIKWLENSDWHLKESEYQLYFEKYVEKVEEYKPQCVLHDMIEARFTIPPDLQVWTAEEMFPRLYKAGLQKVALLVSHDYVVSLSVEQVMEEDQAIPTFFDIQYFDNREEAMEWAIAQK